jgi:hypothetical protein
LPENLVKKTPGKHWRICFSAAELQACKALIACWTVWRRKPRASKLLTRRDELDSTVIKLILATAISTDNSDFECPQTQLDAFSRALALLSAKDMSVEALRLRQRMLTDPTPEMAAALSLRTAVMELSRKNGRRPKRAQLAAALKISERSLYRAPFGKNVLQFAYLETDAIGEQSEKASEPDDCRANEYDRIAARDYARRCYHAVSEGRSASKDSRRKLRKRKTRSLELVWEEDNDHGDLLLFPAANLEAKRRMEKVERSEMERKDVKRRSRELRAAIVLRERDVTFGSWTAGVYVRLRDGRFHWWVNFSSQNGCVNSRAHARRELLGCMSLVTWTWPINNLNAMLDGDLP